ncbi:unnamed protein product [Brassica napus]|uniref:(rape) hypothetical protein n=1 Tax=Brassica napus TaxID=3708 RepID=A0A817ARY9_BRANA|nr:unnamed protein product [Brassica napus]
MGATKLSGMQKQVLSLYRGFLRAARSTEDRKRIQTIVNIARFYKTRYSLPLPISCPKPPPPAPPSPSSSSSEFRNHLRNRNNQRPSIYQHKHHNKLKSCRFVLKRQTSGTNSFNKPKDTICLRQESETIFYRNICF